MTRHAKSSDGTAIAFERAGNGPALVLVDAAGGFRGFGPMGALAAQLESSFTVFRYDRRGRGESSDTPPYEVDREVEDLRAVIEAAGGSAFVHGYSSGAVLALYAARRGLPISKLTLLEPPLELQRASRGPDPLEGEITALVDAGRRSDAVEHFHRSIGVPDDYVAGMRDAPWWPEMEGLAHTLVYDLVICRLFPVQEISAIRTPTLVVVSESSDERLRGWAKGVADNMPRARLRTLPGEWHGVAPEALAPVLSEFFSGASDATARSSCAQVSASPCLAQAKIDVP